jgi:hypothetical protein
VALAAHCDHATSPQPLITSVAGLATAAPRGAGPTCSGFGGFCSLSRCLSSLLIFSFWALVRLRSAASVGRWVVLVVALVLVGIVRLYCPWSRR